MIDKQWNKMNNENDYMYIWFDASNGKRINPCFITKAL